MYKSYPFAKQKNILSKYKKVVSLATTEPDNTLTKKLLPFVSTVISYASEFPLLDPPPQQQGDSDYDDDNNNDSNRRRRGRTVTAIRRAAHANTERNRRERERVAFAALRGVLVGGAQDRVSVLERAERTIEVLRYENQQQQQQLQQKQQQIERLTRQLQE